MLNGFFEKFILVFYQYYLGNVEANKLL